LFAYLCLLSPIIFVLSRQAWLNAYVPGGRTEDYSLANTRRVSLVDFIDKELIQFSMADNVRSIPSIVDGLKFGQRKVLCLI
jgi:DNA topoisomerase-2